MLDKLRPRSVYDVMAAIACFGVLAGGTAYAANTIGSSDVIDESLLSQDIKNGEVKNADIGANSVGTGKIYDGSVGTADVANSALTSAKVLDGTIAGVDLAPNSVTGAAVADGSLNAADIDESGLLLSRMGCQRGKVNGYARIRGNSGMSAAYSNSPSAIDLWNNCSNATVEVRRSSAGVYFVRFNGTSTSHALAISNSDNQSINTSARDNIVSVARVADGEFRVQVEDVTGTGTGTTPADGYFTITTY